jgi:hypothetical protein
MGQVLSIKYCHFTHRVCRPPSFDSSNRKMGTPSGNCKGKGKGRTTCVCVVCDDGLSEDGFNPIMARDFLRTEAPLCWRRQPSLAEIAINANRLGISQQQIAAHLVLEVPDTPLGWAYQDHARKSVRPGQLGVLVTAQITFEAGGVGRLADFEYAMETQGRPCHFAYVYGEMYPIQIASSSSEDM